MKKEFYYQDDRSNKYWCIELDGQACIISNGRVGAKPRETRQQFSSEEEARKAFDRLIAAKTRSGYIEGIAPEYKKPDWKTMGMSEEIFWRLIALLNWKKTGDDEQVVEPVVRALSEMSTEAIRSFEDILAEKLYALDTETHAREIGEDAYRPNRYFSPDCFLYARCCVVANGQTFYQTVLQHPEKMPKDMEFEALLNIAPKAFERKTGSEAGSFAHVPPLSYETFSNQAGWEDKPGNRDS